MTSSYPPSTVAYPLLNQLLDSLMPLPVPSTASTFTLTPMPVSSCDAAITTTSLPVSSVTATTSTFTLPPISSLMSATVQTSFSPSHSSSSNLSPSSSNTAALPSSNTAALPLPLLPQDALATSPHLQQYSAVRQLTHDLQLRKPRHPKRPQLPAGEAGTSVRRIVHTAVYKQKLFQCNQTLKLYEDRIDELLQQTTTDFDKIINIKLQPPHSKLRKFQHPAYKIPQLSPLRIQIPSHNCNNCSDSFQCYTPHCSHVPFEYSIQSPFPSATSSPAFIPIRIESITPPNLTKPPTSLIDLEILISSLNDID